jgi:hypothetical protein
MCVDPVTALAIAGTAASAYGALRGGVQAQNAANFNAASVQREAAVQQQAADYNATAITRRAGERTQVAEADANRQRTVNRLRMGDARANAAASGLMIEGSPLEVLAFNAGQQAQDVESTLLQGRLDVRDMLAEAELTRWQGRNARTSANSQAGIYRAQGREARDASYIRAGTSLLTGASSWGTRGQAPAGNSAT